MGGRERDSSGMWTWLLISWPDLFVLFCFVLFCLFWLFVSGHKVKSLTNPDMRVVIMKEFVQAHFPKTPLLDYALEVEKITTAKKSNLILNVDGVIAVAFVDLLRECVSEGERVCKRRGGGRS